MEFKFTDLSVEQIPERSEIGYLIGVEASLIISDCGCIILNEPIFPVLELAWSLGRWRDSSPLCDFEFDSLDYEEVGVVSIQRDEDKWVVSSCFNPSVCSVPYEQGIIFSVVTSFIETLYHELKHVEPDAAAMLDPYIKQ